MIRKELTRAGEVLEAALGFAPAYWRAPFFRCDERVRAAVGELAGREVWFSLMAEDWEHPGEETAASDPSRAPPPVTSSCCTTAAPSNGAARAVVADAGRDRGGGGSFILEEMTARGLRSVTVSDLLAA